MLGLLDPDPDLTVRRTDPDPFVRGTDPRIRIRTKKSRIRNTAVLHMYNWDLARNGIFTGKVKMHTSQLSMASLAVLYSNYLFF